MKKILFVLVGMILLLVVCSPIRKISNLDKTNESFKVDKGEKTIRHKENIYYYEIDGDTIHIIYPNEGDYWWTDVGNSGYGGWNEQYSDEGYIKGSILIDVVKAANAPRISWESWDKMGITGVLILVGGYNLFWPRTVWHIWGLHDYIRRELLMLGLGAIRAIGMIVLILAILIWT